MALPISVTYTFATATSAIPLSQLDANFTTVVNGINGIGNGTNALANVLITGGTIDNVAVGTTTSSTGRFSTITATTGNITTVNATTLNAATHRSDTSLTFQTNGTTTAMTVTAAQLVGVGTTTPAQTLDVKGIMQLTNSATPANTSYLYDGGGLLLSSNNSNPMYFYTGASERMRIDSSGNVGIGTSSPGYQLSLQNSGTPIIHLLKTSISDGWVRNIGNIDIAAASGGGSGQVITFSNGANYAGLTERARIDSSGNLLVGTTSGTGNGERIYSVTSTFVPFAGRHSSATAGKFWFFGPNSGNNYVVQNQSSIGVYITDGNTSWTSTSDENLKDITGSIQNGLNKVMSLRAAEFTWKSDEAKKRQVGLIAQDVQKVLPEVVDEDIEGHLGVRYTEVVPLLVAAIQELKAQNDELKARVAALETK
jgi:hypothetical protein